MVIIEDHPSSWDEEAWTEHVVCVPTAKRRLSEDADEGPAIARIAVRSPLPTARFRLVRSIGLRELDGIGPVDSWPTTGENAEGDTLSVASVETTQRFVSFDNFFEGAVLRYAKERGLERVQIVVPISIDSAKNYTPMTRLQLVLWQEVSSPLVSTLLNLGFKPILFRSDPIGIDIAFQWTNSYR